MVYSAKRNTFSGSAIFVRKVFQKNGRDNMKAKHALYLGLIIIGAAFLLIDATVLGFIFEAAGLVLLLISALMEWAGEHQDPHP